MGASKEDFSLETESESLGDFFWAKGAIGTVPAPPDAVTTISGPWNEGLIRREVSALDADGDGP